MPTLPLAGTEISWANALSMHKERYSNKVSYILGLLAHCRSMEHLKRRLNWFFEQSNLSEQEIIELLSQDDIKTYLNILVRYDKQESIVIAKPEFILQMVGEILDFAGPSYYSNDSSYCRINALIGCIFDFNAFRDGKVIKSPCVKEKSLRWGYDSTLKKWDTAKFIEATNIRYCPYCNAETVYVIPKSDGAEDDNYRSALDHFLPVNRYPYLALSLYNLVPSCTRCNTSYKQGRDPLSLWEYNVIPRHSKDIEVLRTAHPYIEDIYSRFNMKLVLNNGCLELKLIAVSKDNLVYGRRLMETMFKWSKTYTRLFLSDAKRIAMNIQKIRPVYAEMFKRSWGRSTGLPLDMFICGFDVTRDDFLQQHLGKLKVDLFNRYARGI